jgi:hypothetical protein
MSHQQLMHQLLNASSPQKRRKLILQNQSIVLTKDFLNMIHQRISSLQENTSIMMRMAAQHGRFDLLNRNTGERDALYRLASEITAISKEVQSGGVPPQARAAQSQRRQKKSSAPTRTRSAQSQRRQKKKKGCCCPLLLLLLASPVVMPICLVVILLAAS